MTRSNPATTACSILCVLLSAALSGCGGSGSARLDGSVSTGGSAISSGGVVNSGGVTGAGTGGTNSAGGTIGAGGTAGAGGGTQTGGTTTPTGGSTGGCTSVACPTMACLYGYLPSSDPCGCSGCAPPPDAGVAKDAGNPDSPICLGPPPPCALPPKTCPAGSQLVSPPCGCTGCMPVDGGTAVDGATADAGLSCNMSASQYDNSCSVDSDCVGVPFGNPCAGNCLSVCPLAALNARVAPQYLSDLGAVMAAHTEPPVACACPAFSAPSCCRGICSVSGCSTTGSIGGTGGGGTTAASGGNTGQGGMSGTGGGSTGSTGGSGGSPGTGGNKCTTDQNTCVTDDDCTMSAYKAPISSAADCYCFMCGYPVTNTIAVDCQAAYVQFCGPGGNWQEEHNCPVIGCPAFQARCVAGVCEHFP
jgi:hypothetical protein